MPPRNRVQKGFYVWEPHKAPLGFNNSGEPGGLQSMGSQLDTTERRIPSDLIDTLRASLVAQMVKNPPAMQETWVRSLNWEDPLEKGVATHSSIFA